MAEKCGGILGGGGSGGAPPGFGGVGNTDTPAEIFRSYTSGSYYGETYNFRNQTNETTTGTTIALTHIGPLYSGAPRTWDRIGALIRFNSSPGTPPDIYYVVYGLVTDTLFPEVLLFQGAAQTNGATIAFIEETISLKTSYKWLGIGWHCNNQGAGTDESYGIRAGGDLDAAGNTQGYAPYGLARTGTTLRQNTSLYASQTVGTATAAAPSLFTVSAPGGGIIPNPSLNTGVYMRLA